MSIGAHAEGTVVVSAGPNTRHACFMVCLKLDLYQPKYGNVPMSYTVTPCQPEQAFLGDYGVGTKFESLDAMGGKEIATVLELEPLNRIVIESRGVQLVYTFSELPNGDCEFYFAMDGPNMGLFQTHLGMQLNTMKAFIVANIEAICSDAPPQDGSGNAAAPAKAASEMTIDDVCNWAASQGLDPGPFRENDIDGKLLQKMNDAMLEELGVSSAIKRTKIIDEIAGLAPKGFVEVAEHGQAQQAQQAMYQKSQTEAIMTQAHHNHMHNY